MTKVVGLFFVALASVTNPAEQTVGVQKSNLAQIESYRVISVTPKGLSKTQIFEKELAIFPKKKNFGLFSILSSVTNSGDKMLGFERSSGNNWTLQDRFCNSYEVV